jgi:hypothetical protein
MQQFIVGDWPELIDDFAIAVEKREWESRLT